MRRVKKAYKDYVNVRCHQLETEAMKCHDEYDRSWYNRIIQELRWAEAMMLGDVEKENCSLPYRHLETTLITKDN
jgi:hypothetical protein